MAQTVRELMSPDPKTIDAEESVAKAATVMRDEGVGAVVVVNVSIGDLAVQRDPSSALADISAAPANV